MSGPSNDHMGRRQRSLGLSEAQLRKRLNQIWRQMKRQWRVLCFSEVPSNILRWSHYAHYHEGVVLPSNLAAGFDPLYWLRELYIIQRRSTLLRALGILYYFSRHSAPNPPIRKHSKNPSSAKVKIGPTKRNGDPHEGCQARSRAVPRSGV
jgi:hypothetical protein